MHKNLSKETYKSDVYNYERNVNNLNVYKWGH